MNPGTNGLAGAGIYFATTPDLTGHKAREKGVIIEATVSLGRIHTLERDGDHTMSHARREAAALEHSSCQSGSEETHSRRSSRFPP